jgi:hypothetical protein
MSTFAGFIRHQMRFDAHGQLGGSGYEWLPASSEGGVESSAPCFLPERALTWPSLVTDTDFILRER